MPHSARAARFSACLVLLGVVTTGALYGCGAARSLINDQIDPIVDPGGLAGKQFPVPVSRMAQARAAIPGEGNYAGPFPDVNRVANQDRLNFAEVRQNLRSEITVVTPPGVPLPPRVTLRDPALSVRFYEAASVDAAPTREVTFPPLADVQETLVYTRVGETPVYRRATEAEVPLGPARIAGDDAKRLFRLLTEPGTDGSTTNFVRASLAVTADDAELPEGSYIVFTFGTGQARVGL
jgi:hypothetical protein